MFHCYSLSECYFAGKGTVLMLGSNERLVRPNSSATHLTSDSYSSSSHHRSISNMSNSSDFTLTTTSMNAVVAGSTTTRSTSSTSTCHTGETNCCSDDNNTLCDNGGGQTNGGNDIQKHLQSMFYLLRPEETLKMVGIRLSKSACVG